MMAWFKVFFLNLPLGFEICLDWKAEYNVLEQI